VHEGLTDDKKRQYFPYLHSQGCQIKKKNRQTFSKKGQKRPTKLLKKAKHSVTKGQKRAKPFT